MRHSEAGAVDMLLRLLVGARWEGVGIAVAAGIVAWEDCLGEGGSSLRMPGWEEWMMGEGRNAAAAAAVAL